MPAGRPATVQCRRQWNRALEQRSH